MASQADTLTQLNSARDIVLRDHTLYPQVVPGIIPVIAPGAALELRRWGADFLAETFASQAVTADEKLKMSPVVLDTLRGYLNRKETMGEEEDTTVVKSAVQCAASVFPYVFRHTATTLADSETWTKIASIKSSILKRMDTASPGVRICCIKFVACVVLTQTPGVIADPRRPELNEISLALVSRDHSILVSANLEAEASGLLDRLLSVLQENLSDALIVTATLNALASIVQRRGSVSPRIITMVLAFNPFNVPGKTMSGKQKVEVRSMVRTTMTFLLNFLKRNASSPFAARIQQHVERLKHSLLEAFSEAHQLKRPAPDDAFDNLDDVKRQRLDAEAGNGILPQQGTRYPPLPTGPVSLAQLFTLTNDTQSAQFHVERLQLQVVTQLVPAILQTIPQAQIDEAINAVQSRWLQIERQASATALDAARGTSGDEDDDDYDPSLSFGGDTNQTLSTLDPTVVGGPVQDFAIGPFNLPPPPPLTEADLQEYSRTALSRIFGNLADLDRELRSKGKNATDTSKGFGRLASATASIGHDREGWITLLTRLATRATLDLTPKDDKVKEEHNTISKTRGPSDLPQGIRDALFAYVTESFRARIDVAIMWLNEEWYADRLIQRQRRETGEEVATDDLPRYWHHTLHLLDAMVPYLDIKDGRTLIRFLSEVPAINRSMLKRLKDVADDPERVQLSTNALLYLIMFRPPARELAIDCAEELYRENQHAKTAAKKILVKWRPAVLEQEVPVEVKAEP